jgi:hypothetical protein
MKLFKTFVDIIHLKNPLFVQMVGPFSNADYFLIDHTDF